MVARRVALGMAAAFAVYAVMVAWRGWDFLTSGDPVAVGLGVAVLLFPLLAGILVWRELRFGFRMQELGKLVADPRSEDLEALRAAAESDTADWQDWYWVGVAYYKAGERKQARRALDYAWLLSRESSV